MKRTIKKQSIIIFFDIFFKGSYETQINRLSTVKDNNLFKITNSVLYQTDYSGSIKIFLNE